MSKQTVNELSRRRNKKHDVALAEPEAEEPGLPDLTRRNELISTRAYFRAEKRGFAPGHELEDWLASELEVMESLRADRTDAPQRHESNV